MKTFKLVTKTGQLLGCIGLPDHIAEALEVDRPWQFAMMHNLPLCDFQAGMAPPRMMDVKYMVLGRSYGRTRDALEIYQGSLLDLEKHPDVLFTPSYALTIGNVLIPDGDKKL